MQANQPGDTVLTIVGRLSPGCVGDMQAMLDLLHEEIDE